MLSISSSSFSISLSSVAKRPSLVLNEISLHLRRLNFPEKNIFLMENCGNPSDIYIIRDCGCGTQLVRLPYKCGLRTCKRCSKLRKQYVYRRYVPFFKLFPVNKANFYQFLTIAPKNYSSLEYGFNHIKKSFSKFLRRKYVKERIKAGFYVLETKQAKDGTYNIHIHAVLYGRWLDYRVRGKCFDCNQNLLKYNKYLKKHYCANRNCSSFNVERFKRTKLENEWYDSSGSGARIYGERVHSVYGAVSYLTKYISNNKDDFMSDSFLAEYIVFTKNRRLINPIGDFYGYKFKTPKPVYICSNCHEQIKFSFDSELLYFLWEKQKPPDEARKSQRLLSVSEPRLF